MRRSRATLHAGGTTMTRMSDPRRFTAAGTRSNSRQSRTLAALARRVHALRLTAGTVAAMTLGSLGGCVIPPSLKPEEDAVNSPPAILSIATDRAGAVPEPGPIAIEPGDTAGNFRLSLLDTDANDDLFARIYIDYGMPSKHAPRVVCSVSPKGQAKRDAVCDLSTLCGAEDIGVQRNATIAVFDRTPNDFGSDPLTMGDTTGLMTYRFLFVMCQLPQTPS
jgi:hypothetical protein